MKSSLFCCAILLAVIIHSESSIIGLNQFVKNNAAQHSGSASGEIFVETTAAEPDTTTESDVTTPEQRQTTEQAPDTTAAKAVTTAAPAPQTTPQPEQPTTKVIPVTSAAPATTTQKQATTKGAEPTTVEVATTTKKSVQTTTAARQTTEAEPTTTKAPPTLKPTTLPPTTTTTEEPTTIQPTTTTLAPTTTTSKPQPEHYCDDDSWLYNNGKCYWSSVINGLNNQAIGSNWFKALVTCSSLNANLISIHSSAQNQIVYPMTCAPDVWLGLVASGKVTEPVKGWQWTDLSPNNYTNWGTSSTTCCKYTRGSCSQYCPYPLDARGCSFQHTSSKTWQNDDDCQRTSMPFICEKAASAQFQYQPEVFPVANLASTSNSKCETGWFHFRDQCYWLSNFTADYFQAELTCREKRGQIVSIHNSRENGFVLIGIGEPCVDRWIGLVNINPEAMQDPKSWEWDDMSPLDFNNWPNHTPPNNDKKQLCTAVSTAGYWYNRPCFSELKFVCTKPSSQQ